MNETMITAFKENFESQARQSFTWLRDALMQLAERTYMGSHDRVWLANQLEDTLKYWILEGGVSLATCPDMSSILARLNRLAGERIAKTERGQWQFEKLPPASLYFQDQTDVDMDAQYALMRSLHQLLDRWERHEPKKAIALEMHFWGGFNYSEISRSLDVSDWTVRAWVGSGLTYLRKELEGGRTGVPG